MSERTLSNSMFCVCFYWFFTNKRITFGFFLSVIDNTHNCVDDKNYSDKNLSVIIHKFHSTIICAMGQTIDDVRMASLLNTIYFE